MPCEGHAGNRALLFASQRSAGINARSASRRVEAAGLPPPLDLCSGRGSERDIGQSVAKRGVACLVEGGEPVLSAKEVQPGVLVFQLRDQTSLAIEALGTLQVRPICSPAAIAIFSLRAVPPLRHDATTGAATLSAASPR